MGLPMKAVHNKNSVPKEVWFMIQAELIEFANIIVDNDLRCFMKFVPENVGWMSWR